MKKASIIHLTIIGMLISTTALSAEAHGRRHRGMRRMHHHMRQMASVRPAEGMETQETSSEQPKAPMQQLPVQQTPAQQTLPTEQTVPAQQTPVQVAQETSAPQTTPQAPASAPVQQGIAVGEPNPSGISLSQSNTNSTSITQSSPGSTEEHKETMIITTASLDSGDAKMLGSAAKEGEASASSSAPIIPASLLPPGDDFVPTKKESLDMNFASVMGKDIGGAVEALIGSVSSSMVEGAKKAESSPSSGTSIVMSDEGPEIVMQTQVVNEVKKEISDHVESLFSGLVGGMSLPSSEELDKTKEMAKKTADAVENNTERIQEMVLKSDSDLTVAEGQEHECKKMISSIRDQLMSSVPALSEMAKQFVGEGF